MTLYKFLTKNDKPTHGPSGFQWPIPNGKPGDWVSVNGDLVPCSNGLHLVKESGLLEWLNANLYEAEHDGESINKDEHVLVCRRARLLKRVDTWNDRTTRLFAADCAERVLPLYEKKYPGDVRIRRCIETTRLYANGKATMKELAAAEAAARDAAWAAARDAAWAAAGAAAEAAERNWQHSRLMEYLRGENDATGDRGGAAGGIG